MRQFEFQIKHISLRTRVILRLIAKYYGGK